MKNLPYAFISYSHVDADRVSALILGMKESGIRLWYDEGIEAGSEWPEYIAQKVMNCNCFVLFISNAYLNSQNCKRELNFAISKKKEILSVYLEKVELSPGMEMQLGTYQAVFSERFSSDGALLESLCRESFFCDCQEEKPKMEESKREVPKNTPKEPPLERRGSSVSHKQEERLAADSKNAVMAAVKACNVELQKGHSFYFRTCDELSKKQKANVLRVIARGKVSENQVISVMDDTLFGSGKSGYLVTEDRFFCAGLTLDAFEISLTDLVGVSCSSQCHLLLSFADGTKRDLFFNHYYECFLVFFETYLNQRGC